MPEVEPNQDESDENENEELEREQAKMLNKGEKSKQHAKTEKAMLAQIHDLKQEVNKLKKQLEEDRIGSKRSGNSMRGSGRMSIVAGGLLTASRRQSSAMFLRKTNLVPIEEGSPKRNKPIMNIEDVPDPEVDELFKRNGKLDNDALTKINVKQRKENDTGRAGFRMLMEAREEDTVAVVRVDDGVFSLPSLTRLEVRLKFIKEPRRVLVIKKPGDEETLHALHEVIDFLSKRKVQVCLETSVKDEVNLTTCVKQPEFVPATAIEHSDIDFIVCLGGDGTILWASGLFSQAMPPVVSFKMGSLGFLTPFPIAEHQQVLRDIMKKDKEVTVRARIEVTIKKKNEKDIIMSCLNEVVAKHPSRMISLDLFCNDIKLTTVYADGLIVATPTGSTAYSLACGGSMVHPAIPAMVVTPIAPHTLSFRPIVLPDSSTLRLVVPESARDSVYLSLDGRNPIELAKEDAIEITVSQFPVAAYCNKGESADWFKTITESFLWNVRTPQKRMD